MTTAGGSPADADDPADGASKEPARSDAAPATPSGAALAAGALVAAIAVPAVPTAAQAATAPETAAAPANAVAASAKNPGPGAARMAKMCGDSTEGICHVPKWSEDHLTLDAVLIGRYVAMTWGDVKMVGGWRPSDPYPDHPSGRAVDIMMPNGGKGKDKKLGDEIAAYFQEHADEYGVEYILWRQRTWTAGDGLNKWKDMEDRGSPTANHMDHVHITVKGDANTIAKELIEAGGPTPTVSPAQRIPVDPDMTRTVVVELFDHPGA